MDQQGRYSATAEPLESNEGGFIPELLKDAGTGVQRMIRAEVDYEKRQARREMAIMARRARPPVAAIIWGSALTLLAVGFLLIAGMFALEIVVPDWLAALIVGVIALIAGALTVSAGRKQLRKSMRDVSHEVPWLA